MYIVIEIQYINDRDITTFISPPETLAAAESRYYTILAAAAISNIPIHSATILNEQGAQIAHESYSHEIPAEINETE